MPHQPYGYGLDLIGRFTRLFADLMQHWTTIAPDRLIEVSYEALVSDPDVEVRNLLSRCGLPFAESCLRFHQSGRSVATASHLQVREPIHSRSIGQWHRYEKYLGPLQAELGGG